MTHRRSGRVLVPPGRGAALLTALLCAGACPAILSCAAHEATPAAPARIPACDGGRKVRAVFATGPQPGVELTLSDGRKLALPQVISASGARYANGDESVVFWNKGRTAFVEEAGQQTYSGCLQTQQ